MRSATTDRTLMRRGRLVDGAAMYDRGRFDGDGGPCHRTQLSEGESGFEFARSRRRCRSRNRMPAIPALAATMVGKAAVRSGDEIGVLDVSARCRSPPEPGSVHRAVTPATPSIHARAAGLGLRPQAIGFAWRGRSNFANGMSWCADPSSLPPDVDARLVRGNAQWGSAPRHGMRRASENPSQLRSLKMCGAALARSGQSSCKTNTHDESLVSS